MPSDLDLLLLVPDQETSLRLAAAAILGILLGLGRELRGKTAGLRTHGLMALSAAALCLAAEAVARDQGAGSDRLRIFQALAQALGFLAAGAILGGRGSPRGLTTAVGLWIAGTVGIACGFGLFALAVTTTLASILLLELLPTVERLLPRNPSRSDDDERIRPERLGVGDAAASGRSAEPPRPPAAPPTTDG